MDEQEIKGLQAAIMKYTRPTDRFHFAELDTLRHAFIDIIKNYITREDMLHAFKDVGIGTTTHKQTGEVFAKLRIVPCNAIRWQLWYDGKDPNRRNMRILIKD